MSTHPQAAPDGGGGAPSVGDGPARAIWPRMLAQGRVVLREIGAGAAIGLIALPFCVTAGVLAYEPLGRDYIGAGAAAGIASGIAGGVAGALARSSSFIPNVPSVMMSLIQASFLSGLLIAFEGDVTAVLVIMPLSILCAGAWQILIGLCGLARIIKFAPYPVLAGFVTGLAVLTFTQQAPRLFGVSSLRALPAHLADMSLSSLAMPILGLIVILVVQASNRWTPRLPAMLVSLVIGTFLWHAAERLSPSLDLGHTIGTVSLGQASLGLRFDRDSLAYLLTDRSILQSLLFTSLTIALLGCIDWTFAFKAAQNLSDLPEHPRRDLAGQGVSNIVAAVSGAIAVTSSIAFARTIHGSGGRTRLSAISVALVLLVAAAFAPTLVAALPTVVLSAILVSIAFLMWDRWCIEVVREALWALDPQVRTRARRNAAILLGMVAATVFGQPVLGALTGIVISCVVFIMEMSRPIVRRQLDCSKVRSKRVRSQSETALLRQRGTRTAVLELQGVLFFGNGDDLAAAVRHLEADADTIILDLRRVTDVDTSGASILRQIAKRCEERGLDILLCGVRPTYRTLVGAAVEPHANALVLSDLDAALEWAEGNLLEHGGRGATAARRVLRLDETDLAGGLSERDLESLRRRLDSCSIPAGAALCRTGDPADKLWLLTRGSVSVRIAGVNHHRRIACLGPGTSVGELGILDRHPRSADVVADEDVEAYVLSAEDFDALMQDEPKLGQSLLATIARLTAQRLRATSDELRLAEI